MTYRVEISPTAIADVERIFLWLQAEAGDRAHRWVRGCYETMLTLENFPNRCALAVESQYLDLPVRQQLYKKHYQILFTVVASTDPDCAGTVQIHRVLWAAQARLQERSQLFGNDDT